MPALAEAKESESHFSEGDAFEKELLVSCGEVWKHALKKSTMSVKADDDEKDEQKVNKKRKREICTEDLQLGPPTKKQKQTAYI